MQQRRKMYQCRVAFVNRNVFSCGVVSVGEFSKREEAEVPSLIFPEEASLDPTGWYWNSCSHKW